MEPNQAQSVGKSRLCQGKNIRVQKEGKVFEGLVSWPSREILRQNGPCC
jgi:hypothetical protein